MPELSSNEAAQTAYALDQAGGHSAFVAHGDAIYFARRDRAPGAEPMSPLVKLVQGIYQEVPDRALSILRGRIHLTHEATPMCWGMMKVTARRLASSVAPCDHGLALGRRLIEMPELSLDSKAAQEADLESLAGAPSRPAPGADSDRHFLRLAQRLAAAIPRAQARRFDRDRAIAALLVSVDGELLAAGMNTITRNRTFHAELNAVQSYWRRTGQALPAGTRVYTTLKSCRMCAGMLWQACVEPRSLRILYAEDDPGPNARETVFNSRGLDIERRLTLG